MRSVTARSLPALVVALLMVVCAGAPAQEKSHTTVMRTLADSTLQRWPEGRFRPTDLSRRLDALGTLLDGMEAAWYDTADGRYYEYIRRSVEPLVDSDGANATRDSQVQKAAFLGRQFLLLYRVTQDKKYYEAAKSIHDQLIGPLKDHAVQSGPDPIRAQPNSPERLYRVEPFLAEYASVFHERRDRAETTRPFVRVESRIRDARRGMRDAGWTLMALVDTLPYYPASAPGRAQLLAVFRHAAAEVVRAQDARTGLWSATADPPTSSQAASKEDSVPSSIACMFTYALARGARLGYLPHTDAVAAERAWKGMQSDFLRTNSEESATRTESGMSDPEGVGLLLLAASEMELQPGASEGLGREVLLDGWYNSQTRRDAAGRSELYHYKWDDSSDSGFSLLGHIFRSYGVKTATLETAPTVEKLRGAQYYILVSPDNPAKNPKPHLMNAADAQRIAAWVRAGGVLLMMENDPANADIDHMDILADRFGLHFNKVLVHHVAGDDFAMGRIEIPSPDLPFLHPHVLYMKDTCSLTLSGGAKPLLQWKGDTLMAIAPYGKGTVVAVTDPWLYNEYTDGRKLPAEYDNFAAGREFVAWVLQQH